LPPDRIDEFRDRVLESLSARSDWSQKRLAKEIDVSPGTVSNLLNGKTAVSYERANLIAATLEIDITDLLLDPDIYVAAPMTTLKKTTLRQNHKEVDQVLDALHTIGLKPYWPGAGVKSLSDAKDPRITTAANFEALGRVQALMLLLLHEATGPTGALIELGYAMGQGRRITIFIEKSLNTDGKRPFVLEGLVSAAMEIDEIAPVEIIEVEGIDEVVARIESDHGAEMLMGKSKSRR
jgi:transcriptional regulator with XRE-family HTH domain